MYSPQTWRVYEALSAFRRSDRCAIQGILCGFVHVVHAHVVPRLENLGCDILGVDGSQDNIERNIILSHRGSRMHFLHLEDGLVRDGCHKLVIE